MSQYVWVYIHLVYDPPEDLEMIKCFSFQNQKPIPRTCTRGKRKQAFPYFLQVWNEAEHCSEEDQDDADTARDIYAGSLHDWFEPGDTAPSGAIHQPDSPCRQPESSPLCLSLSLTTVAYTWPTRTGWPKLIVDFTDAYPVVYCELQLCMCAARTCFPSIFPSFRESLF